MVYGVTDENVKRTRFHTLNSNTIYGHNLGVCLQEKQVVIGVSFAKC